MKILDGKKLADKILLNLKKEIKKNNLKLRLAVVSLGKDKVSEVYLKIKERTAKKIGVDFKLYRFEKNIDKKKLSQEIRKIVANKRNSGVIIQLPLPKKFPADDFLNLIPFNKDVDLLSFESLGKFYQGISEILPPTVSAVSKLFREYRINLKGKNIVLLGSGRLVGKPLAVYFINQGATVLVLNKETKKVSDFTKKADILISGTGQPGLVKGKMIKKGETYVSLEAVKWSGHLSSPVSGEIIDVNEELFDEPSLINRDPYGSWIMKVKMSNPEELKELLNAKQIEEVIG